MRNCSPGTFQFPRRIANITKFRLRALVYHERVPGQDLQSGLQVENKDLPLPPDSRAGRDFGDHGRE